MTNQNPMTGLPRKHISWSQISSLEWSAEQYKRTYIYNKRQDSIYLTFGKAFHEALQYRDKQVPKYLQLIRNQIPPTERSEIKMTAEIDKIPILGYIDGMNSNEIIEYKTGKQEQMKSWKSQLSLYALLHFQNFGKLPKSVKLYWAQTLLNENDQLIFSGDVREYDIEIKIKDILEITRRILKAHQEIKRLVEMERNMFGKLPYDK